jgi:hypothetical protein
MITATVFEDTTLHFTLTAYSVKQGNPASPAALAACFGCSQPVDVTDAHVKTAISFLWNAVVAQDSSVSSVSASQLTVISAQSQIVNGVNYILHVQAIVGSTVVDVSGVVYSTLQGALSVTSLSVSKSSA